MRALLLPISFMLSFGVAAQQGAMLSDPLLLDILKGDYDPQLYAATQVIDDHADILCALRTEVSPDSLLATLELLGSFHTRNSYSDTTSNSTGIGAARRWAHDRFAAIGAANEGRLLPGYLSFDVIGADCGDAYGWKNVLAVLPGRDTTDASVIIIEGHIDSRCEDACDPQCYAAGIEDNGSGTALVLELARVMSRYTFDRTLVFMLTTGEEQGLIGATAMAEFCTAQGIRIKAVQNNDVVGGILCGETSSPPSCPSNGAVDSLQVRLFSSGNYNFPHRGFARTVKLYYTEKLMAHVPVPMTISIMNQEDRTGRGGDHMPFRAEGFRNLRFCAANEHGDADVDVPGYSDRQHTGDDILGVDTDNDLVVDSFFVDKNYLARNTVINVMSATLLALGPATPEHIVHDEPTGLRVSITTQHTLPEYRIGVRMSNLSMDFDGLYRTTDTSFVIPNLMAGQAYYVSVAGVDANGIMSPFSKEFVRSNDADTPVAPQDDLPFTINCAPIGMEEPSLPANGVELLAPRPNPFQEHVIIGVRVHTRPAYATAALRISDMNGRRLHQRAIALWPGTLEVDYHHQGPAGMLLVELLIDGRSVDARRMIVQ